MPSPSNPSLATPVSPPSIPPPPQPPVAERIITAMSPDIPTTMFTLRLLSPAVRDEKGGVKALPQFSYRPVPTPLKALANGDVLIRIMNTGVCGSDEAGIHGYTGRRNPADTSQGLTMGHEASGEIVAITRDGAKAGLHVGDRVTFDSSVFCGSCPCCVKGETNHCDVMQVFGAAPKDGYVRHGSMAEYLAVPARGVLPLPSNVSFPHGATVEPIAVGVHAARLASLHPDEPVLVIGSGLIGLLLIQTLKTMNVKYVMAVDVDDGRLQMAKISGASATLKAPIIAGSSSSAEFKASVAELAKSVRAHFANHPGQDIPEHVRERVRLVGFRNVFEVAGKEPTLATAGLALAKGGRLIMIGNEVIDTHFNPQMFVTRGMSAVGSCAADRSDYEYALQQLACGGINVANIITHNPTLSEVANVVLSRPPGALKIMIDCQGGHPQEGRTFFDPTDFVVV